MTIEDLKTQLAVLTDRIAALEAAELEAEWPKNGDKYYYIASDATVGCFVFDGDKFDIDALSIGNGYRTLEDAEREVERRKVLIELRKLAKASWGGTKIDWTDYNQHKWQIRFAHDAADGGKFGTTNWLAIQHQGTVAFATKPAAEAAIETIGADRLMLLLED